MSVALWPSLGCSRPHPRRPRGSQSVREKRQDESCQVRAKKPLGTPGQLTTNWAPLFHINICDQSTKWWFPIKYRYGPRLRRLRKMCGAKNQSDTVILAREQVTRVPLPARCDLTVDHRTLSWTDSDFIRSRLLFMAARPVQDMDFGGNHLLYRVSS